MDTLNQSKDLSPIIKEYKQHAKRLKVKIQSERSNDKNCGLYYFDRHGVICDLPCLIVGTDEFDNYIALDLAGQYRFFDADEIA